MNTKTLPMTADQIRARIVSALTQYDAKESTKRGYNRNALGIYLRRVDEIMADIAAGADVRAAICAGFLGRTADACLRSLGLPITSDKDTPRGWCYVPIKAKETDGLPDDSDPSDPRTHSLAARDAHARANDDLPAMDRPEDY